MALVMVVLVVGSETKILLGMMNLVMGGVEGLT